MQSNFLPISKLSLVIGLWVYGGTIQATFAGTTTIKLPATDIFEKSKAILGSSDKEVTNGGKDQYWLSYVTKTAFDSNGTAWLVMFSVDTKTEKFDRTSKAPDLSEIQFNIGHQYSNLSYVKSDTPGVSYLLSAQTNVYFKDNHWRIDNDFRPTISTTLDEEEFPVATTKITANEKSGSFEVTTP
jgi:hypothetical protein